MSYSFTVEGKTTQELEAALFEQLDAVVANQPVHAADVPDVRTVASAFVKLLVSDRPKYCTVNGSIWKPGAGVKNASVTVSVGYRE
jgi:hypothetical protein